MSTPSNQFKHRFVETIAIGLDREEDPSRTRLLVCALLGVLIVTAYVVGPLGLIGPGAP